MSLDSWGHGHDYRGANRQFWFTRIQNIPKLTPLKKEFTSRRKKYLREIYRGPTRRSILCLDPILSRPIRIEALRFRNLSSIK